MSTVLPRAPERYERADQDRLRESLSVTLDKLLAVGPMFIQNGYLEGSEIADPAAPGSNHGRLYFRDNGSGKTQLVAVFPTGAVQVIVTEP